MVSPWVRVLNQKHFTKFSSVDRRHSGSAAMELWITRASNLPVTFGRAMMERCESGDANARSGTRR
jgi:hypothetical protein